MGYVVRSVRETGTITYHCCSTGSALEKLHDFRRAEYSDITISSADEDQVTECQLVALIARETAQQAQTPSWVM